MCYYASSVTCESKFYVSDTLRDTKNIDVTQGLEAGIS